MMKHIELIWAAALVLGSCGPKQESNTTAKSRVDDYFTANIKTVKPIKESQIKEITFAGRVVSNPDLTVSYAPLVSGVIERTYFSLGDRVVKGQKMLDIRSAELSLLDVELIGLEADLQVAKRVLKSAEGLFADHMLSEKEYLEVQGQARQAQAAYDKAQADMSIYGMSKGGGVFSVTAPASGYVVARKGSAGGAVFAQSEPLFTIADLREIWVEANVYAGNLQFVSQGMEAFITSVSYPNEVFRGTISSVSNVFDAEDKTLKARIVLPNVDMKLKPEMSVAVKLRSRSPVQSMLLPSQAVIFDNDRYFVVIGQPNGGFERREVTISGSQGDMTNICSGVETAQDVVVKNQLLIYNELKGK